MSNGRAPLEMWGGVECTVNRVGDRWFDQMAWSGHHARVDDLDRIAALGIRTVRYPVLWEHLAPRRLDDIDWRWTDQRLGRLRELGIRPIVGLLHHGSGPGYTSLLDPDFASKLAAFAGAVSRRYPWVTDFTPVNEPLTTARFSALYGHWYPHQRNDRDFIRALLNQLHGVVLAMQAIREVIPHARLVQTEDCGCTFGTAPMQDQVAHEEHRRWLTWDLLAGRVGAEHPLYWFLVGNGMTAADEAVFRERPCAADVIGLNYYLTSDRFLDDRLDRYPPSRHGGNGAVQYADVEAVRVRRDGIAGHEAHLLAAWERYRCPLAITEVHLGCSRDEQIRWLVESWRGAEQARQGGADVRAVTAWALLGSYNWNSLVTCDGNHYEPGAFDVRGPQPRPTALAAVIRSLATGDEARHPALTGPAWWVRPERLLHAPVRRPPGGGAPAVLILGTGTLARAFQEVCDRRGLSSRLIGRMEVDITDPTRVDAVVRRVEPWAVINAAGYVRVDQAEAEADQCRGVNVTGAVNLAAACRRHGLPFVTFSSDLVFDGNKGSAYVEGDVPAPVNVYGAAKAEAERRVLDLLPAALVIRTSAFFGPWDKHNFVTQALEALDRNERVLAPADTTVSPTYVPDLVDAVLDLLIDGEAGVWHLANRGAVTWFDLACAAAALSGRSTDQIEGVPAVALWHPAPRPAFTALTSERGLLLRSVNAALEAYVQDSGMARSADGADAPEVLARTS